jgi:ABC-2 type transport system permease protein
MRVFLKLTRSELRLFLREPVSGFFSLVFPALLVIILGSIPSFREPSADLGGLRVIDLYVPIIVALILAMLGLQTTPYVLALYREKGVLRRMAVTPAPPLALLGAQLVMSLLSAVFSALLVLLIGRFVFDVALPANLLAFAVIFLLAAAAVFSIGLFIAAVVSSGKAANAIGTLLFFPSMFFAGLWAPREVMPDVLARVGDFTPLGAGVRALQDASTGTWPALISLTVLVAYVLGFGAASAKLFRWE